MEVKVRKAKDRIVDSHSGVWAHEKSYAKCSNIRGICGEKWVAAWFKLVFG
jgi:hypothetical protein